MKVLVLTESDDCAGPMAAAFLRDYGQEMAVVSAGRKPAKQLHPLVIEAMKECLTDMGHVKPNALETCAISEFDFVYEIPEQEIPADMEGFRCFRDRVKNESFLFYRDVVRKATK